MHNEFSRAAGDDQFIVEREPLKEQSSFEVAISAAGSGGYQGLRDKTWFITAISIMTPIGLYLSYDQLLPLVSTIFHLSLPKILKLMMYSLQESCKRH